MTTVGRAIFLAWCIPLFGGRAAASTAFQSFDGSDNNADNPAWGAVGASYAFWFAQPGFTDGVSEPPGMDGPSVREISQKVFSSPFRYAVHGANDLLPYFGQFICHDIALINDDASLRLDIPVETCDPYFDPNCEGNKTIPFKRSEGGIGPDGYRVSLNRASSYIDASMVYGYDSAWNANLRTGSGGLLKTSSGPNGELLPLNSDIGLSMAPGGNTSHLFAAGDPRANVNLPMVVLHTLFHLEHNHRARYLAELHPDWDDDRLFNEARRYVIALLQKEHYYHYVPAVTGKRLPEYTGYNASLDAAIDTTFITTAFRYGHSSSSTTVYLAGEDRHPVPTGHLPVGQTIFNPSEIKKNGLDNVMRGLLLQPEADADVSLAEDLRNHAILADLASFDMQRGRDRGVRKLNDAREDLGMSRFTSFEDLTPDTEVQALLQTVYPTIDDVDLYTGGLAERPVLSGIIPPTYQQLFELQWVRLRAADRFHFENPGVLDEETLQDVRDRSLKQMVLDHTGIETIAGDMFLLQEVISRAECEDSVSAAGSSGEDKKMVKPLDGVTFGWKLDSESETIQVEITAATSIDGWVAVGFSTSQMVGSDVVMCRYNSGTSEFEALDAHIPDVAPHVPVLDAESNVDPGLVSGSYESGVLSVNFTRSLRTSDLINDAVVEVDFAAESAPINFIFAYGTEYGTYHGRARRAVLQIDLLAGDTARAGISVDFVLGVVQGVHGAVMVVIWLVLLPISILMVHHHRSSARAMNFHQTVSAMGSTAVVSFGAIAILINTQSVHQVNAHRALGAFIIIWNVCQVALGWFMRSGLKNSTNLDLIILCKRTHKNSGRLLVIVCFINIWLGIKQYFGDDATTYHTLLVVYGACFAFGALLFEIHKRRKFSAKFDKGARIAPSEMTLKDATPAIKAGAAAKIPQWTCAEFLEKIQAGQKLMIIGGKIIDIASYTTHPGGDMILKEFVGTDATAAFFGRESRNKFAHSVEAASQLHKMSRAKLVLGKEVDEGSSSGIQQGKMPEHALDFLSFWYIRLPVVSIRELNDATNKVFELRIALEPSQVEKWIQREINVESVPANLATLTFGQHLKILCEIQGEQIVRLYTPSDTFFDGYIAFVVKTYPGGKVSHALRKATLGGSIRINGPHGPDLRCKGEELPEGCWPNLVMFSGGSGLTPSLAAIAHHIRYAEGRSNMWLVFCNSTEQDFFYMQELKKLEEQAGGKLKIFLGVSKPSGAKIPYAGDRKIFTGYINEDHIKELGLPPPPTPPEPAATSMSPAGEESEPAPRKRWSTVEVPTQDLHNLKFLCSGPFPFCQSIENHLKNLGYGKAQVSKLC